MAELKFSPGDYVRFRLALKETEGFVLESHDKSVVLLKLKSGYNVGVPKENILGYKVIRKLKEEKKESGKIKKNKELPFIGLVVTGGTIASKLDSQTGGVKALTDVGGFARLYPRLFEKVNVRKIESPFMLDSSSMSFKEWVKVADSVKKMLDDKEIKGVIVTHGTDTLHYASAVLSFSLRNLNKPVILTYSQRSIDRASSDAELNLECAAEMALSDCAEVVLLGHSSMNDDFCLAHLGTKVRKMHSSRRDAFKSINTKPIAKVFPNKVEFISNYRPRNKEKTILDKSFSDKVAIVKFYPGQKPEILDFYLKKGYKGIVIEAFGLGQIASSESGNSWISMIKKLVKSGVFVCAAPQTLYGRLHPEVYSAGRELKDAGVVFLEDMLPETAFVKLSWVLGHRQWRTNEKVRQKMLENFSGEINELLTE